MKNVAVYIISRIAVALFIGLAVWAGAVGLVGWWCIAC